MHKRYQWKENLTNSYKRMTPALFNFLLLIVFPSGHHRLKKEFSADSLLAGREQQMNTRQQFRPPSFVPWTVARCGWHDDSFYLYFQHMKTLIDSQFARRQNI